MTPFRHFFLFLVIALTVLISPRTADAQPAVPAQMLFLDCTFRNGNGIFTPQQSIILDVTFRPQSPNVSVSDSLTLHAALTNLSVPDRPSIAELDIRIVPHVPLPISFVTPDKEGCYEITLSVSQEVKPTRPFPNIPRLPDRVTTDFRQQSLAEIRRQFIVLTPQCVPRLVGNWTLSDTHDLLTVTDSPSRRPLLPFPKVTEFPRITDSLRPATLLKLPPFGRRISPNLSSYPAYEQYADDRQCFLLLPDSQRHFLEKSEQNSNFSALSAPGIDGYTWYSMPMDVEKGKPYLVEIDYPVDIPQMFGAAVVNGLAFVEQYGGWSGKVNTAANIHVARELIQDTPTETVATHQLLFWAETESAELVLINRQPNQEAMFRNIRLSRVVIPGQQEDQRFPKLFEETAQRKRIGQILGTNDFLHLIALNSMRKTMDWQEIYEGCSRLIDKLCQGGYDGVTLTVLSKHSSLFPTTGDTLNCLEMMFRRFNSEGLTLIPAIEFDMLIPSLEQLLAQHPGITEQVLIGNPEHRQYNLLHPAVQQAMAEIVLDLVNRFGHHPSFGGIAIVLSPETYAQLPFALYPPDDHTFMQFRQDTERELGCPFPDEQRLRQTMPMQQFLAQKNMERLQFLKSNPKIWETWVCWRATKVSGFYANLAKHVLAKQVSARHSDAPLYLLGGMMLDQPEIQQFCMPTLPRNYASLQALQLLGFDLSMLSKIESLHFLRPVQISDVKNYSYDRLNSIDAVSLFSMSGILPGVQFVHTDTDHFVTTPAHTQSRKRFVQQLAQADVLMFMDGGVSLPFGQEAALFDLLATYRQLPPVPFQTFQPAVESSVTSPTVLQPLTIRYKNLPEELIIYIVNDAPFAVEADFCFSADPKSSMTELSGQRMIRSFNKNPQRAGSHTWRSSLLPYDLLAIRINDVNAKIESVSVHCPPSFCGAEGALKQKVEELEQRIQVVRNGLPLDKLVNAHFESPADAAGGIVGWQCFGKSLTAQLDQTAVCKGESSVKLTNSSAETGTFLCQPLSIPATGRWGISMYVGVPTNCQSLPMNVVLTAKHRDMPFYRSVPVGETLMSYLVNIEPKNGVRWHQLIIPGFPDLLPEPLEEVRIGIQYLGNGTVWLDDITLYHILFSTNELLELQKMLFVAGQRCSSGRVSDLISLLEGYWSQFLFQYVPAPIPQPITETLQPPIAKETVAPPKPPTLYQRAKSWFVSGRP